MASKIDLASIISKLDRSFNSIQELRAYMRGFEAAGGKPDFHISGLDEALETASASLMDSKVKYQKMISQKNSNK